jgi:Tyrosine-protein kinase ephrin type A/B receptor-like
MPGSCVYCPWGTTTTRWSEPGIMGCICKPGYTATSDGVVCAPCEAGTFKDRLGTGACHSCSTALVGTTSAAGAADCFCLAGYEAASNGVACSPCDAGTYKDFTGTGGCTECPVGTYKTTTGPGTCDSCPLSTTTSGGSDALVACVCLVGYTATSTGATCTQCAADMYKNTTGTGACTPCPVGTHSSLGQSSCTQCPVGTYGSAGASTCTPCAAGMYNNVNGSDTCTPCLAGQYSSTGASVCTQCPIGTYGSTGVNHEPVCVDCTAGSTSELGSVTCVMCPIGTYGNRYFGSTECIACVSGATTLNQGAPDQMSCLCTKGTYGDGQLDGTGCTACVAGATTPNQGARSRMSCLCDSNEHPPACPAGSGVNLNICNSGTVPGTGNWECDKCASNTYNPGARLTACHACPAGTQTTSTGSVSVDACNCVWTDAVPESSTDCFLKYPPIHALSGVGYTDASSQYSNSNGLKQWFDTTGGPYATGTYTVEFSSWNNDPLVPKQKPSFIFFQPDRDWTASEVGGAHWGSGTYTGQKCVYGGWNTLPGKRSVTYGEWVIFSSPEAFKLKRHQFVSDVLDATGLPFVYTIYGWKLTCLDDGVIQCWETIPVPITTQDDADKIKTVNASKHYSRYGLLVQSLSAAGCQNKAGTLNFHIWNLWGTTCIKGTYVGYSDSNPGESVCIACPVGTYTSSSGRESCLACPTGMTTIDSGSISLTECRWNQSDTARCAPGHHCTLTA